MNVIVEMLLERANRQGAVIAIDDGRRQITYSRLASDVMVRAGQFARLGIEPGDVLRFEVTARYSDVTNYLGAMAAGAIAMPVGSESGSSEPPAETFRVDDAGEVRRCRRAPEDYLVRAEGEAPPVLAIGTSGSMGASKMVAHSDASLAWALWNTCSIQDELALSGRLAPPDSVVDLRDALIAREPDGLRMATSSWIDRISGVSVLHRALLMGNSLRLCAPGDAAAVVNMLANREIDTIGLTPFVAREVVRRWRSIGAMANVGLLNVGIGGGLVTAELRSSVGEVFGCMVTVGYGSTEAGGVVCCLRPWESNEFLPDGSVGRAVGAARVVVRGGERGAGELWCDTPSAMVGYLGAERIAGMDGGSLAMRDIGSIDPDGFVTVLGRSDDLLVRGGILVDPREIERVVSAAAGGAHVVVVNGSVGRSGEPVLTAIVEGEWASGEFADAHEIRRRCAERLGPARTPRAIVRVSELPRTPKGEVSRSGAARLLLDLQRGAPLVPE